MAEPISFAKLRLRHLLTRLDGLYQPIAQLGAYGCQQKVSGWAQGLVRGILEEVEAALPDEQISQIPTGTDKDIDKPSNLVAFAGNWWEVGLIVSLAASDVQLFLKDAPRSVGFGAELS
jgi:hypothetical protein